MGSFSTAAQPNQSIEPIVRRSMWSRENEKQLKRKDEWKKERVENKLGGSASGSTLAPPRKSLTSTEDEITTLNIRDNPSSNDFSVK